MSGPSPARGTTTRTTWCCSPTTSCTFRRACSEPMMMIEREDGEPDVVRYLRIGGRRWKAVALSVGLGVGIAAAYAFLSPPVYQASTLIDVERMGGDVPAPNEGRNDYSGEFDEYFETQVRLIASDTQLRKAYKELQLGRVKEF